MEKSAGSRDSSSPASVSQRALSISRCPAWLSVALVVLASWRNASQTGNEKRYDDCANDNHEGVPINAYWRLYGSTTM